MAHDASSLFASPDASLSSSAPPTNTLYGGRTAALPLHILIIGCGLGGLSAAHCLSSSGHRITLLEAASAIGDVGAGIQVTPNVSRLLIRWGLGDKLRDIAVVPEAIVFRRYENGEMVGYTRWGEGMEREWGAPYLHIHRADFHKLLYDLVRPRIDLRLKSTVVSVSPGSPTERPSVTLASGEVIEADLVVGADGVKSTVQQTVLGKDKPEPAEPTGDAAYRAIIPTSVMLKDPELAPFVDTPEMTAWMGPRRHLMAYCIRAKREYNMVLLHPDDGSVESWTAPGSADAMRRDFADFEPRVQKLLSHVKQPSTLKWRLMGRRPLSRWVHPGGRVVLLGDACHPMLPYRAQGAAMALEDSAVLGSLLSRIERMEQLGSLLRAYEELRYERTKRTQESSRLNQRIFHLEDGREQEERDGGMRRAMDAELGRGRGHCTKTNGAEGETSREQEQGDGKDGTREETETETDANAGSPNQWADRAKNAEQFGYDADAEAERWWAEVGVRSVAPLGTERAEA